MVSIYPLTEFYIRYKHVMPFGEANTAPLPAAGQFFFFSFNDLKPKDLKPPTNAIRLYAECTRKI
jgi:hypothetical protein